MVKTRQGWVLQSPLELLAVEAVGGATSASAVGGVASAVVGGVSSAVVGGVASALAAGRVASAVGGVASASVVGGAASAVGGAGGVDGVCSPGSGVPGGGGCDVIRGSSDSGHMANGGGHIVEKVLGMAGDLGGGGSPFWVVGT
eukprot:g15599.t1